MARRPWTEHPRIISARRRSALVDVVVRTLEGHLGHRNGRNAALIAHYGFLSVFPLMLVFTTILGFILQDRPDLQADIIDSAFAQIPIVGETIGSAPEDLRGSTPALVFGLLVALWSGTRAFVVVQATFDDIHELPLDQRSGFVATRGRALLAIAVIGVGQIAAALLTSRVGIIDVRWFANVALIIGAAVLNGTILGMSYRWLCSTRSDWHQVLPGAVFGGIAFALLQLLGTTIVARAIANASPVYGTFASVIGLLLWLSLHATVALAGAELNRVLRTLR